jgi:hypothetical protein
LLAVDPDLGDEEVTRIAFLLLVGQLPRRLEGVAAVAPEREAAGHHLDVLVAQVLHRLRRERGAVLRRAVGDHPL